MSLKLVWGPTFEEMEHPAKLPAKLRARAVAALQGDPLSELNLFNITWRDAADRIRHIVLPESLTGVAAPICVLIGAGFPTGSHKVGPTYSCCVEKQVDDRIQPGKHRLVWPSTGNYGIGGAYVGPRMGYASLVLLPERMSRERYELIESYGASYVKTPGCESNVKEIYDEAKRLAAQKDTVVVNQFCEFGNYRFHYAVTGAAVNELFEELREKGVGERLAGFCSAMGSAGTIAAGDRAKELHPECRIVGLEPIQCPTLYANGFGDHDIQGIGDKHVTWIHNTDNMDAMACIDEWECKKGMQLLYEEAGREALAAEGVDAGLLQCLHGLIGISGVCNILGAVKAARHYRLGKGDILFTVATDSTSRYLSTMQEMDARLGRMDRAEAARRFEAIFLKQGTDFIREGTAHARDCWANLKYFTWVEQQGKGVEELRAQRSPEYWAAERARIPEIDRKIRERRGF